MSGKIKIIFAITRVAFSVLCSYWIYKETGIATAILVGGILIRHDVEDICAP